MGARCHSQLQILDGKSSLFSTGEPASNLYISGLPPTADELYLYKAFAPFGGVLSTFAKDDKYQNRIGFVTFAGDMEAQHAIDIMHGQATTEGTQISVKVQQQRKGTV